MSKRSGNSRRSTRSKRRERREEEKEERLLHIFARFSIATIALYRKGNRWISGLIKKFQRSLLLSQSAENSGSDFSSREEISLSTMSVRSLGSFFFFFFHLISLGVYIGFSSVSENRENRELVPKKSIAHGRYIGRRTSKENMASS